MSVSASIRGRRRVRRTGLLLTPFLGERLEDLGRFVAHDVFALGHRADQAPKDRQTTQRQVRTAVVDPDLRVEF